MRASEAAGDPAARIRAEAERIMALGESGPRQARDPVNLPIIENWTEAIGDSNPVYTDQAAAAASVHGGLVAPPAMAQVGTMPGLGRPREAGDPMSQIVAVLEDAGYTSVVATNSEHVFRRYVRHGERLTLQVALAGLTGPKRTALGEGWFFTTRHTWYSGDEVVATMDFRILKFRPPAVPGRNGQAPAQAPVPVPAPAPAPAPAASEPAQDEFVLRPVISPDTQFFWDGLAAGELRIQRCPACGALRHPPGPMCPRCGAADPGYQVAAGTGTVFSYVVHHHPPVPGKTLPLVIALAELDEGVRVLAEMPGLRPDQVRVGLPVRIGFLRVDDTLTLPAWYPAASPAGPDPGAGQLPTMTVDVTPTFVVAAALATRDFTPVHHDRDLAIGNGSKDIFLNILTDTGLVQRFLTQWAGPNALIRAISIRLGVPCYAGDTLRFAGEVTGREPGGPDAGAGYERCRVAVTGRCGLGDHIIATAVVDVPGSGS
ncbi:MAG: OB-fold domain-containing protein [Streptosporangiaceae bacterium]